MLDTIIKYIFKNFIRNMIFFHIIAVLFFFIIWMLERSNKMKKFKASELIFGISAILYGLICILYYFHKKI